IAPGIVPGIEVEAGQLIGWVGDSGNAEGVYPHLHWEVRSPDGYVNPTPHADAAIRIPEPGITHYDPPCPDGAICDTIAMVDPGSRFGLWDRLDDPHDTDWFYFGNPGDLPFMGDWDGDGEATPCLYRQSDGFVYIRDSNTEGTADREFFFGDPGDVPLVGDFDGDGRDSVSIWRASEARVYIINELGEDGAGLGAADYSFAFGNPGDQPFIGDFDGDGTDTVGLYRTSTGFVYFTNRNETGTADFEFYYGIPGDVIFAGDWDGNGVDTVAVFRSSTRRVYMNLDNAPGSADWAGYVGTNPTVLPVGGG
ncbi:MAG: M23 family metallopeptidase, partial [Acidimicrobiia bacterium]|nr:M23 family metallopeptidase [Acidimicrobiia bacterium]